MTSSRHRWCSPIAPLILDLSFLISQPNSSIADEAEPRLPCTTYVYGIAFQPGDSKRIYIFCFSTDGSLEFFVKDRAGIKASSARTDSSPIYIYMIQVRQGERWLGQELVDNLRLAVYWASLVHTDKRESWLAAQSLKA